MERDGMAAGAGSRLVHSHDPQPASGHAEAGHELSLALLDQSGDCIKVLDTQGRLVSVNKPGLVLLEIDDADQLHGSEWTEAWPQDQRGEVARAVETARGGAVYRFSGKCPTAKGTDKWWDVVVSPVRDRDGSVARLLAVSRDVTAAKRIEQRLADSEQRFRALADNMAQFAWMGDGEGSIFWYNQRWYDYTGLTEEQSRGWGWQAAHHPDHLERVTKKLSECFARGSEWEDTYPLRSRDGEYRWFLSRAMPIRDASGRVSLWCGTNTDVTDQRSSGLRLRQMARLIELSHEAIIVWDVQEGVLLWNEGCEELYGYSRAEAVGRRTHALLQTRHATSADLFDAELQRKGEWTGEVLHISKDGREVWVDSRQELMRFGDRSVVLETNRDITERRRADDTRNILVAEIDHRVKNTLAIVQSIARQTARNSKTMPQFIASFSDRLQALSAAHNLLTDRNWRGADLAVLLKELIGQEGGYRHRFDTAGPDVVISSQTALQLSLILHELVSNARVHGALTRPSGRVSLHWRIQHGNPERLHMTWRESGGPPVSPPASYGFGLMLISRAVNPQTVQAQIAFEPNGICCHIVADLPATAAEAQSYFDPTRSKLMARREAASAAAVEQPVRPQVLIIEDEPLIALEIEDILTSAGFVTLGPAATIEAALDAIGKLKIDAALLDLNLFGKSVESVVEMLQAKRIPFAYVSGGGSGPIPEASGIPFVEKPVKAERLTATVQTLTRK